MTTSSIVIRPAVPADAAAVENLLESTFRDTWLPELNEAAARRFDTGHAFSAFVVEALHEIRVAELHGRLVGMVYWQGNFIDALHVYADVRRQGVARALMDVAEAAIAAQGFATVRLETDTFNISSQGFYLAHGYRELDRYPDEEWQSGFTTILYEKTLK